MMRNSIKFLMESAKQYGDLLHFKLGPQHVFLLSNPDDIKNVLVTDHGNFLKGRVLQRMKRLLGNGLLTSEKDLHRRQRRLVQPAFHQDRLVGYSEIMTDNAERLQAERWCTGDVIDISQEMTRLTLVIVGKTLFGAETQSVAEEVAGCVRTLIDLFNLLRLPYSEWLEKLPLPSIRRFDAARDRLDSIIYAIIVERRKEKMDGRDLLSMLLAAQDSEGAGGGMSDRQLRDEVLTIFLAGHETTANALTWTWYLLSRNEEVETRLHNELDRVLSLRLPRVDDLPKLQYTEMVFKEALRLYPPAWTVNRTVINDYKLRGYTIPAQSIILMSQYVTHHDERYFPNPFSFEPERWTSKAQAARPQYSYFPFGGGPRRCVGEGFAMMEGVLLLATLARRWRMRGVSNKPVEFEPLVTLRPKHAMAMRLEKYR
jgi:cytochrome P450